jgi:hypothetical protein
LGSRLASSRRLSRDDSPRTMLLFTDARPCAQPAALGHSPNRSGTLLTSNQVCLGRGANTPGWTLTLVIGFLGGLASLISWYSL